MVRRNSNCSKKLEDLAAERADGNEPICRRVMLEQDRASGCGAGPPNTREPDAGSDSLCSEQQRITLARDESAPACSR